MRKLNCFKIIVNDISSIIELNKINSLGESCCGRTEVVKGIGGSRRNGFEVMVYTLHPNGAEELENEKNWNRQPGDF